MLHHIQLVILGLHKLCFILFSGISQLNILGKNQRITIGLES